MDYQIKLSLPDALPERPPQTVPYAKVADLHGELRIVFALGKDSSIYENRFVNVPLFLSELDELLRTTSETKSRRWYLGFAPFAYGRLRDGALLISSRPGDEFFDFVYDLTTPNDLKLLKSRVKADLRRFGKVRTLAVEKGSEDRREA